jgi:DNA repair protein RadA/Sms
MFFCTECGTETAKWAGKCPYCGAWDSLKETTKVTGKRKTRTLTLGQTSQPEQLIKVGSGKQARISSGFAEFDGTLGGGIVPGMVVLIGGEPGIGKSTLMLQISDRVAKDDRKVLYVSGEESNEQIVVIDSIQSIYLSSRDSSPGSISQLRECTSIFTRIAKQTNIPIFLIGHVTKDGIVAGPKIIEHMVDTVLYFEGESQNQFKILRATKNRFGSTNEIGIFEMQSTGLQEVKNPSQLFLSREDNNIGSAVGCVLEGSRAFLVEVQALVSPANYGTSQRVALGFDHRKLAVLLAVIEKNLSLNLRNNDVFINLAGGMKVLEPALDLAIIAAIISSFKERALPANTLLLGEIGLNGEIRPVSQLDKRLKEAQKLGFDNIIISARTKNISKKIIVSKIKHIKQLFPILFSK